MKANKKREMELMISIEQKESRLDDGIITNPKSVKYAKRSIKAWEKEPSQLKEKVICEYIYPQPNIYIGHGNNIYNKEVLKLILEKMNLTIDNNPITISTKFKLVEKEATNG